MSSYYFLLSPFDQAWVLLIDWCILAIVIFTIILFKEATVEGS